MLGVLVVVLGEVASVAAVAREPATAEGRVLSLAEAERQALAHQPQILQAKAQTSAARARADESRAPLLPQVTVTASYGRQTANFVTNPGSLPAGTPVRSTTATFDTFDAFRAGVSASQLVYDFGQTTGGWRAAQSTAEAQAETEEGVVQSVLVGVRSAYVLAWAERALVGVAQDALAHQDRHLAQVQGLVQVGSRPEIDLAQVRADRANAALSLINAENAYETAKAQLNQAMGVDRSTSYDVADDRIAAVSGEELGDDRLTQDAVAARPELRTVARQLEAEERQLGSTKGAYGPSIGVSTAFTEAGTALTAMTWNWNAVATLTWPLFQGGITDARVREVEANTLATRSQKKLTEQQIRFDVTQARLGIRGGKAALEAAREVEKNARERLRMAEARYQAGAGSIIELQDAQLAATAASGQVVQADYGLSVARAQLVKALGRR